MDASADIDDILEKLRQERKEKDRKLSQLVRNKAIETPKDIRHSPQGTALWSVREYLKEKVLGSPVTRADSSPDHDGGRQEYFDVDDKQDMQGKQETSSPSARRRIFRRESGTTALSEQVSALHLNVLREKDRVIASLEDEIHAAADIRQSLEGQVSDLQRKLDEKAETGASEEQWTRRVQELFDDLDSMKADNVELATENAELTQQLSETNARNNTLEEALEREKLKNRLLLERLTAAELDSEAAGQNRVERLEKEVERLTRVELLSKEQLRTAWNRLEALSKLVG